MADENTPDTPTFRPQWIAVDPDLACLLDACYAADPDELSPQLALADMLAERDDPREKWVRVGCELWTACRELRPGMAKPTNEAYMRAAETEVGRRMLSLFGCLAWWHSQPHGGMDAEPRACNDPRNIVVQRVCWWSALGFIPREQLDEVQELIYSILREADLAGARARAEEPRAILTRSRAEQTQKELRTALEDLQQFLKPALTERERQQEQERRNAETLQRERLKKAEEEVQQAIAIQQQAAATFRHAMTLGHLANAGGSQLDTIQSPKDAVNHLIDTLVELREAARLQSDSAVGNLMRFVESVWELCEPCVAKLSEA